jgi:uncharacterized membrane protein
MKIFTTYIATLVVFLAIDMVWLGFVAKSTYAAELGPLIRSQFDIKAAVVFYLVYAAGLHFFAITPAHSAAHALFLGAALGAVAYGTYDLTNLSVINGFGLKIALIDWAWGTVLSAVTAVTAFAVAARM